MLLARTLADTKAWEVDTLRGHVNNVSCVMFHARQVRMATLSLPCWALPYEDSQMAVENFSAAWGRRQRRP